MGKAFATSFTMDGDHYRHVIKWMQRQPARTVSLRIAEVLDKHVRGEPSMKEVVELLEQQTQLLASIEARLKKLEETGIVQYTGAAPLVDVPSVLETEEVANALDGLGRN